MSDRPEWWNWIADKLPRNNLFKAWVVFAILFLDHKGIAYACLYWDTVRVGEETP